MENGQPSIEPDGCGTYVIEGNNDEEHVDALDESDEDNAIKRNANIHSQADSLVVEPLTEEEIEELIAELLEVESKAAEAQEALEEESLINVEADVRKELAQSLSGDELDKAVSGEMAAFREQWEVELDKLETESSHLLEQLDGAGIDLSSLYTWIERQAPNGCCTIAWKNRTHWAGTNLSSDARESVTKADEFLQVHRPVRRRHGKVLVEGASGFLGKRVQKSESSEAANDTTTVDWDSFSRMCSDKSSLEDVSFGSKHLASVYLANTSQQAAELGLKFPGFLIPVDEHIKVRILGNATSFHYCSPKGDTKVGSYNYRRKLMITFYLRGVGFIVATLAWRDLVDPFMFPKFRAFFSLVYDLSDLHEFPMHTFNKNSSPADDGFQTLDCTEGNGWTLLSLLIATEQSWRILCSAALRYSLLCEPRWHVGPAMEMLRGNLYSIAAYNFGSVPHYSTGSSGMERKEEAFVSTMITNATSINYALQCCSKMHESDPTKSPPNPVPKKREAAYQLCSSYTLLVITQWLNMWATFSVAILLSTLRTRCFPTPG